MKKLRKLIGNIYRICIVNPSGRKRFITYSDEAEKNPELKSDSLIRQVISGDSLPFEADPQIREMLLQKVRKNGYRASPIKNSLLDMFIPLFSAQHIEIKMAVISVALFLIVGLGPKTNQASERKMHFFFLADTIGDSSSFHNPASQDTAFRVQFK